MLGLLSDPLGRGVLWRALLVAGVVVLTAPLGLAWSAGAGLLGAILLAATVSRHVAPLKRRVLELTEDPEEVAAPSTAPLAEIERRVELAGEQMAEERRKALEERDDVMGILEATSEGILVVGHHHRIELINDAARRLLAAPPDPLGRSLPEVVRAPGVIDFAEALRRGEELPRTTVELADPTDPGHVRSVSLSGAAIRGDHLRSRAVLVLQDLSELVRLESIRTDFVANATHEMRSPLASILGYAETLAESEDLSDTERESYLQRILKNSRRLDGLISDLIELSRLEHATGPEMSRADVATLIHELVEGFRDRANEKGVALAVDLGRLPDTLELDAELVHQALVNLVDNAVKYTPSGGQVRIEADLRHLGDGRNLVFAVTDTGPGIPREHHGRIFERFYRVDTARSRALGGTGLGLAIVKHAAALHGGTVELESSEEGSTFRLILPV